MLRIKDNIDLKELEKFGFFSNSFFQIRHRAIYSDNIEQFVKQEWLLIHPITKVLIKAKQCCILDIQGNNIIGYDVQTNRVRRYIPDLIQANLVEKVGED